MGFNGPAGRLIGLGEREGREQLVAPRALLLRDCDGGLEGFFGGCGIGGLSLQKNVAAQTMEVGVREMLAGLVRDR